MENSFLVLESTLHLFLRSTIERKTQIAVNVKLGTRKTDEL